MASNDPPENLAAAGSALWGAVTADYQLDPPELAVLALACRQSDDVATLEAELADQGPTVEGSKGQPRLSPIFAELRQSRLALAKLLAELRLPIDAEAAGLTPASRRAQHAANVRWGRARQEAEARGA